jgi:hypothetical protein
VGPTKVIAATANEAHHVLVTVPLEFASLVAAIILWNTTYPQRAVISYATKDTSPHPVIWRICRRSDGST